MVKPRKTANDPYFSRLRQNRERILHATYENPHPSMEEIESRLSLGIKGKLKGKLKQNVRAIAGNYWRARIIRQLLNRKMSGKEIRESLGISQLEYGTLLGLERSASFYGSLREEPEIVAKKLGISVEELMNEMKRIRGQKK